MKSVIGRRKVFFDAVRDGPIFGCVCCHRIRFRNGVVKFDITLKAAISKTHPSVLEKSVGTPRKDLLVQGAYLICLDCKLKLMKGKVPSLSHKNNLELVPIDDKEELLLSELENCLIAQNIPFQKFVQLPTSRWTATKDKIVNIPISESDVLNTIKSFPRTPDEAGIVPGKLKRKKEYKGSHKQQYVSTTKILKALNTLKDLGNKYYQFVPDMDVYKQKCKTNDPEGFALIFDDEDEGTLNVNDEAQEEVCDDSEEDEDQDKELDHVNKWKFLYNKSTCFMNDFPELEVKEEDDSITDKYISVAPGEGKVPSNILNEKDWDIKSFPCLHPNGTMGLHEKRAQKITDQKYFEQRILNYDRRFANMPPYVFASYAYIEKNVLERNINIYFMRGKPKGANGRKMVYSLEDPYSVLDNSPGTPR